MARRAYHGPDGGDARDRALGGPAGGGRGRRARGRAGVGERPAGDERSPSRRPAPRPAGRSRAGGDRRALRPSGRGAPGRRGGAGGGDDRHGLREVAVLQPADARRSVRGSSGPRALPVSDKGAGPGPGARACAVPAPGPAPRDLRRRHAARAAGGDPPPREPGAHQSRHAARRDPAQPLGLGRLPGQPGRGGRGRGARLPRRVRLARGQHPASTSPPRRRVRDLSALPARLGDDREPDRAGRATDRTGGLPPHRPRRRAARPAADRHVEPAAARRRAGHARVGAGRGIGAARRSRANGCADDLLHQLA